MNLESAEAERVTARVYTGSDLHCIRGLWRWSMEQRSRYELWLIRWFGQ